MAKIAVLGSKMSCLRLIEALGDQVGLIVTVDDSADGRSQLNQIVDVGARFSVETRIASTTKEAYRLLTESGAAVVLVSGWYRIIPPGVLNLIPHGFVGVHYSALPSYRGSAPVVWALMNGDERIGFSIFRMAEGMDTGPLAAQGSVSSGSGYIDEVLDRLDAASISELSGIAFSISEGNHLFSPQSQVGVSFSGARSAQDGEIDWTRSAEQLARFIRAQSRPYPGAFTYFEGKVFRIWRASCDYDSQYFGVPGQVIRFAGKKPVIACGRLTGLILDEFDVGQDPKFSLLSSRLRRQPQSG